MEGDDFSAFEGMQMEEIQVLAKAIKDLRARLMAIEARLVELDQKTAGKMDYQQGYGR